MPIRPEMRDRYPENWAEVSLTVRERANQKCECRGECGADHPGGRCAAPNGEYILRHMDEPARWGFSAKTNTDEKADVRARARRYGKPIKVILTVAHLDHQPNNINDSNLRAFCQFCHLRYDRFEHARNAVKTKARKRREAAEAEGQRRMFDREP